MVFYRPSEDCQISNLSEIYLEIFGEKTNGIFLEIGAFDGETMSNTVFLADMGWEGYYFEPVVENAIRCQIRHISNNVKTIPCAISDKEHDLIFSLGGMLTSARKDHVELFNQLGWRKHFEGEKFRAMPAISVQSALRFLPIDHCDLAVIDVEGFEPLILDSWDFTILKPSLFILESRDNDLNFSEEIRNEYINMLDNLFVQNYQIIHRDGCNVILKLN